MNKSSNTVTSKQVMSNKSSRSCKFVCTERDCQYTWFTGSKEPSWFAKKWPHTCENCERKKKTKRERAAKEEKEEREKALVSKRSEVQQAK